jgi:hypothetical protein
MAFKQSSQQQEVSPTPKIGESAGYHPAKRKLRRPEGLRGQNAVWADTG